MLVVALLAFFGNAYQYQKSFDVCYENKFELSNCKWHKKMVDANYKSIYHK